MVNGVSFGNGYSTVQNSKDIENVVKYLTGTTIVPMADGPFQGMGIMLGISGLTSAWQGGKWVKSNWGDLAGGWNKYKAAAELQAIPYNNAGGWKSLNAWKLAGTQYDAKLITEAIPKGEAFAALSPKAQSLYTGASSAANFAAKNTDKAGEALKFANQQVAEANALVHAESIGKEATGFFGTLGQGFKKYTGLSALEGYTKNLAVKSPTMASILKFGKGNALFIAITGGVELFTQVIPAFHLGADKGAKQIGKSAVKTGASVAGWVAGSALGTKGGAMLGAAIGSAFPGVGTVIGGVIGGLVGFVGGCVGSWAATKGAEAIVGKSEVEIAKEEQASQVSKKVAQAPEQVDQLLAAAAQKLQAEGVNSEDAKVAFGSLRKLAAAKAQYAQNNSKTSANAIGSSAYPRMGALTGNEDVMSGC